MAKVYDAVVIGGGIVGNFVAFELARRGVGTCLLEQQYVNAGCSGAGHAWLIHSNKPPGYYGRFCWESQLLYEQIQSEFGVNFEYTRSGNLQIIWTDAALAKARETVTEQQRYGLEVELLTPDEVAAREPVVSPRHIKGALWGPNDAHVDPFLVGHTMAYLAGQHGAEYRFYTEVARLERQGGHYRLTTRSGEHIAAETVCIAAGVWSRDLFRTLGLDVDVQPTRGQLLATESVPPTLHHIVSNASIRQIPGRGGLIMGRIFEDHQSENANTYEGLQQVLADLMAVAPTLAGVKVVRAFSGLRPMPFDGMPLLGEVPGCPGLFSAVTHAGVTLGAIVGRVTAELVTGQPPCYDITPFQIARALR